MDLDALNTKLKGIQDSLDAQETTLKDLHKDLSENQNLHSFEKEELRRATRVYMDFYYNGIGEKEEEREEVDGVVRDTTAVLLTTCFI